MGLADDNKIFTDGKEKIEDENLPKLHLKTQSVPRSKHTPSQL